MKKFITIAVFLFFLCLVKISAQPPQALINNSFHDWTLVINEETITLSPLSQIPLNFAPGDRLELYALELLLEPSSLIFRHGFGYIEASEFGFELSNFVAYPIFVRNLKTELLLLEIGQKAWMFFPNDVYQVDNLYVSPVGLAKLQVSRILPNNEIGSAEIKLVEIQFQDYGLLIDL